MRSSRQLGILLLVLGVTVFAAGILALPSSTQGGPAGVFTIFGFVGAAMLSLITVGVGVHAIRTSTATVAVIVLLAWIVGGVLFAVAFFDLLLFLPPVYFAILSLLAFAGSVLAGKRVGTRLDDT